MKKILLIVLTAICLHGMAQQGTPDGQLINYAYQMFKDGGEHNSNRKLAISQNISPRAIKPGRSQVPEKIQIMYVGHWFDITDEVSVSGPGTNSTSGVTFSGILEKKNGRSTSLFNGSGIFPEYNGAFVIVEFEITSAAAVGTHKVKLRRPRVGFGKDESREFYIEVMDIPRIHKIRFKQAGENTEDGNGRVNEIGKVIIYGQNLGLINFMQNSNILNENNYFSNISNKTLTDTKITFDATLIKRGDINYNSLMPASLKNAEYPQGSASNDLTVGAASNGVAPVQNTCPDFASSGQVVACNGPCPNAPTLVIEFVSGMFKSGDIISAADRSNFSLCSTGAATPFTVPRVKVRVTNTGNGASAPTTLYICGNGNPNVTNNIEFPVPALGPGATSAEFEIPRIENRVSVVLNGGVCQKSNAPGAIIKWNDIGVKARIRYNRYNGTFVDNKTIQ